MGKEKTENLFQQREKGKIAFGQDIGAQYMLCWI